MLETKTTQLSYDEPLESALAKIEDLLKGDYGISRRTIGLLLLQGDQQIESLVKRREASAYSKREDSPVTILSPFLI